jgi:DNA-binding IclR family transcriptional regulator
VGKALLGAQDDAWLDAYFHRTLERETVYSIIDETQLRDEIASARERGFATTRQEMTLGNISIAAAIPATADLPPAAVGVVTHLARADERRLGPLVVAAARDIARELARP